MQVIGYDPDASDEEKQARTIGLDWDMTCLEDGGLDNRMGVMTPMGCWTNAHHSSA